MGTVRQNNDLRRVVQRKINKGVLIYIIIDFFCVVMAFAFDINREYIYKIIKMVIGEFIENNHVFFDIKCRLQNNMKNYCDLVTALDAILAAAVIFFYSIQDNRKGGIPHRKIMAYTFGTFTIPILFIITLLILPFCYLEYSFDLNWTLSVSILFSYINQMMIIILILTSTSYQYSVYAITNVEIRQFQALGELGAEKERKKSDGMSDMKVEQNLFFSWTYLQHHLEQVTVSDELVVDKLLIARRILRVPYYQGEIRLREELLETKIVKKRIGKSVSGKGIKISAEKMKSNNLERVYEFYYENLLTVFEHINQSMDFEYRDKIYLILYEFLEELTELYEGGLPKGRGNYMMTIAGILNAVLSSEAREAEGFCDYVFNNVISKDVWNEQISLYFLFQEYLYRTNSDTFRLGNFEGIENIERWENKIARNQRLYGLYWSIWTKYTTILPTISYRYYNEAIKAFAGKGNIAGPAAYIMHIY